MGFFERFKKRLAIKSYARLLPRLLAKDYGRSKSYTRRRSEARSSGTG